MPRHPTSRNGQGTHVPRSPTRIALWFFTFHPGVPPAPRIQTSFECRVPLAPPVKCRTGCLMKKYLHGQWHTAAEFPWKAHERTLLLLTQPGSF